ncbi:ABC transporter substrate-binding protein [Rhizobium sp. L1K21]|nr:ABC transporter substrate-binding protein [Rhizobium sp. L1K21]MCO6187657.1 ABC transporter substrate-binding protein [Rhizobium sp. L1K21]
MVLFNRRQTLGLMGAAAASLATPAIAQNKKIVVGALNLASHSGSFIALERGYFADAGLDVELKFFQAAQPMAVAIASGDVDFGVTAITGGLISLADKGAVKVFGGALTEEPGIEGQKILASNAAFDAGVKTPKDMDGKRFGVTTAGSSFHYMGSKVAEKEGVKLEFVPLQKVGAVIGALKSGQIDAWSIVPNIAGGLTGADAAHEIGIIADYLPNYQVTTLFTSAKNASDRREETKAFLTGYNRGAADYNAAMVDKTADDADALVEIIHKYVYSDQPIETASASIKAGSMRLSKNAALNLASVRDQLSWFQSEDLVDKSISIETLVDTSYVDIIEN